MIIRAGCLALCLLVLVCTNMPAGTVVLGNPPMLGTGNCDPFGCPAFLGVTTYQQVYLSTAFTGDIDIDALTFYQGQIHNAGASPAGGTYALSLSYTTASPGNLSLASPADNIGAGSQTFFTGSLPALTPAGSAGDYLIINGTPFDYNPDDGNLLLTVTIVNGSQCTPALFLDQAACGPKTLCPAGSFVVSSSAYFATVKGLPVNGGNDYGGLVTGFSFDSSTVPEPASWLLMLSGAGLIGYWRRRV